MKAYPGPDLQIINYDKMTESISSIQFKSFHGWLHRNQNGQLITSLMQNIAGPG